MYRMMTPGPTEPAESVLQARAKRYSNPDVDLDFVEYYKHLCEEISRLLDTKNETLILGGEGILGLEAACASLTEPGDKVLVIENGIFGEGFQDFVKMYGGEPCLFSGDRLCEIDVKQLEDFLEQNHDFKYATVVHGDTPSGVKNQVEKICPLLKKYGILTVVDAVSTAFGDELHTDRCQIDLLCGGSQKAVSAPPGLTFVVLSEDAKKAIRERTRPIASFYANLQVFENYYTEKWFPYTMPISDIYGLGEAIRLIAEDADMVDRHTCIAEAIRETLKKAGLELYLKSGYANTVTAFRVPKQTSDRAILERMKQEHHVLLSGSFGELAGKVIRIGHMGQNATAENMVLVLETLQETLEYLNVPIHCNMKETFLGLYKMQTLRIDFNSQNV